jgi:hypothetical protein
MTTIGEAIIEVRGDVDGFDRDVRRGTSSSKMGALGKVAGRGLAVGFAAAAGAVLAGGAFLKGAFDEAEEAVKVGKQTAAVIKATGGIAGVSADHVSSLAEAISKKVGIDDEAIQSGSNLLLTFKKVRNEAGKGSAIFDRATKAAVDLSAAGFGSITGSSKMLGKALNDPIKGMSAMSRAGVTFTEQQQNQVKALVESGDTLKAQKIIMKEVESQVGGSAEAQATAADKMGVAWGNFKEDVGSALMPVLTRLMNFITAAVIPGLYKLGPVFDQIGAVVGPIILTVVGVLGKLRSGSGETGAKMEELRATFSSVFASIKTIVVSAVSIIRSLWQTFGATITAFTRSSFSNVLQIIRGVFNIIAGIFKVIASVLKGDWRGAWEGIKQIVRGAGQVVSGIVRQMMNTLRAIVSGALAAVKGLFKGTWGAILDIARTAFNGLGGIVGRGMLKVVSTIEDVPGKIVALGGRFADAGKAVVGKIFDGIRSAATDVGGLANDIASAIKGAINGALNLPFTIKGPGPLPDFTIPAFARGTRSAPGGPALVGEEGPEIVNLPRGAEVITAARTRAMRRGGNVTTAAGKMRLIEGTLSIDERGRAFIRGVASEEIEAADRFAGTIGRMR